MAARRKGGRRGAAAAWGVRALALLLCAAAAAAAGALVDCDFVCKVGMEARAHGGRSEGGLWLAALLRLTIFGMTAEMPQQGGGCTYKNCESPDCHGGACLIENSQNPTCKGRLGVCIWGISTLWFRANSGVCLLLVQQAGRASFASAPTRHVMAARAASST